MNPQLFCRFGAAVLTLAAVSHPVAVAAPVFEYRHYVGAGAPSQGTGLVLSAASVSFAATQVGASASSAVILTNGGDAPVPIVGVGLAAGAPDFSLTSGCPALLASSQSCVLSIVFTPRSAGTRSGAVTVNASGRTTTISLAGSGLSFGLEFGVAGANFGVVKVGTSASMQYVALRNPGSLPVTIQSTSLPSSGFSANTASCPATLVGNAQCTISLGFLPVSAGALQSSLILETSAGPYSLALQGRGALGAAQLNATALDFGDQTVSQTSAVRALTLTNTGEVSLSVNGIGMEQPSSRFAQTNNCAQVAPGSSCQVNVVFTPTAEGTTTERLLIATDGVPGALAATLSGRGALGAGSVSPSTLNFNSPQVQVGYTGAPQTVTLMNSGAGALTVSSVDISAWANYFQLSQDCTSKSPLQPGESCTATVVFAPPQTVLRTVALRFFHNGSAGVTSVSMTGRGVPPTLEVTAPPFGTVHVGETATASLTVTNVGLAPAVISDLSAWTRPEAPFQLLSST